MIENLKTGVIIILAIACWLFSSRLDSLKENINDQVQAAKDEKARIERLHADELSKARMDYLNTSRRLDDALNRLRNAQNMSRGESMYVANSSKPEGTMPGAKEDTGGTQVKIKTFQGTCNIDFYESALKDAAQCEALIEYIKSQ